MSEGDNKFTWREFVLNGQTPQDFIVSRVQDLRKFWETAVKIDPKVAEEGPPGKYDVAYTVQVWINEGVITEEEVAKAVDRLGLAPEEVPVFMSQTLPEIRKFMAEQRQKEAEEAERQRLEAARKYTQQWGPERLDAVADYFQKNLDRLTPLNRYWGDYIERYKNQRTKLEQELQQMAANPVKQTKRLMRALYYLTFFHPSEAERIFKDEQEYDSYVYMDSLLEGSQVMFQTNSGKDPDFEAIHFGSGGIGVTVTHYDFSNPKDVRRHQRAEMMDKLVCGARTFNETRAPWKKQISRAGHMKQAMPTMPPSNKH